MKNKKPTPDMSVIHLSKKWSPKAWKLLQNDQKSGIRSVFELYLRHMLQGGSDYRGFRFSPLGIGMKTYQEIRRCLMRKGFPDLSHDVFEAGYSSSENTRQALKNMLEKWKTASRKERKVLTDELTSNYFDGC